MSQPGPADAQWVGRVRDLVGDRRALPITAAALAGAALAEAGIRASGSNAPPQNAIGLCLLALGATLPLAWLRPAGAAWALWAAVTLSLLGFHVLPAASCIALLVALYRLGRTADRVAVQALAALLPLSFLVLAATGGRPMASAANLLTVALAALTPLAAWAGMAERQRQRAEENTAARQVIESTLLEHTARGERARIARELHDVVAHHISMVAVQAEAARLTTPGMPVAGAQRLSAIGDTARAALTEMRRLLGVLRTDVTVGSATVRVADRHPQPGLGQLNDLLDQARQASGTGIRLVLTGTPVALDPGVELAAYRITQEALTNARRHAPGAAVDVELQFRPDDLRLRIRDNGPGPSGLPSNGLAGPGGPGGFAGGPGGSGGQGLPGMRERAAAVGGDLRVGAGSGGGFLIEAILPMRVPEIAASSPTEADASAAAARQAPLAATPTANAAAAMSGGDGDRS